MATKKAVNTEEVQEEVQEEVKADPKADWVEILLYKDNNKYRKDKFVAVNGKRYMIKRGEPVLVPPEVAEVIRNSQIEDARSMQFIEKMRKPVVVDQA